MLVTLQQLQQRQLQSAIARETAFRVGEAHVLAGHADEAIRLLTQVIGTSGRDQWSDRARFLLARAYEQAGQHAQAAAAYESYLKLGTLLAPYALMRKAAQEDAAGAAGAKIKDLEAAAKAPIAPARRAEMIEELIKTYGAQAMPKLALARYRDLLQIARKPEYRATVLLRAAGAAKASGEIEQQRRWLREIVERHPDTSEALTAVGALDSAGAPVAGLQAGRIFFRHEQYTNAITRFDAALAGQLDAPSRFEARRLRALALRETGDFEQALGELGALAGDQPATAEQRQAQVDYIQTVGQSGNRPWAVDAYRRFAASFPQDPLAPEALWRAIQLQRPSDESAAAVAALDLGKRYGRSDQAHAALDGAGRYFEANNRQDDALAAWQLLAAGATGGDAAAGYFRSALLAAARGDGKARDQQLRAALVAAPESFYAARARELLAQDGDGQVPLGALSTKEERQEVEQWIAGWTKRPAVHVDERWLPDVAEAPETLRARELGALDLRDEARDEWFGAKERWNDDPERLWQLALLASLENQPYVAIKAAERIVALSPAKRIAPDTPRALLRLIFPAPYTRVARQYAAEAGLDTRLLYAFLRQESLFNPDAHSSAGARGLAQVMPDTGTGIARSLDMAGFDPDLLYRPAISLRFGAFYFGRQMRAFDGSILAAAAAYNGGPGNAARWREISSDPDRFADAIDYHETRDYVQRVYGNWGIYRALYSK